MVRDNADAVFLSGNCHIIYYIYMQFSFIRYLPYLLYMQFFLIRYMLYTRFSYQILAIFDVYMQFSYQIFAIYAVYVVFLSDIWHICHTSSLIFVIGKNSAVSAVFISGDIHGIFCRLQQNHPDCGRGS